MVEPIKSRRSEFIEEQLKKPWKPDTQKAVTMALGDVFDILKMVNNRVANKGNNAMDHVLTSVFDFADSAVVVDNLLNIPDAGERSDVRKEIFRAAKRAIYMENPLAGVRQA